MQYLVTFYIKDFSKFKKKFGIIPVFASVVPVHSKEEVLTYLADMFKEKREYYSASVMEELGTVDYVVSFCNNTYVVNPFYSEKEQRDKFSIEAEKYIKEI